MAKLILILNLVLNLKILAFFYSNQGYSFIEKFHLLPKIGLNYHVGVNGVSAVFMLFNTIINLLAVGTYYLENNEKSTNLNWLLIAYGLINGVIASCNLGLFYIFSEALLLPTFFMIINLPQTDRIRIAFKALSTNFFSSILLLGTIIYLQEICISQGFPVAQSLELINLYKTNFSWFQQLWIFGIIFTAIWIKLGNFPFHEWSISLQLISPKIGLLFWNNTTLLISIWIILKLLLPITSVAYIHCHNEIITLLISTAIYIALIMGRQTNLKNIIIYIGMFSMNFILLGLFSGMYLLHQNFHLGISIITSSIILWCAQRLTITGLCFTENALSIRTGLSNLNSIHGLTVNMPVFGTLIMFFYVATIGLPGTASFGADFLILFSNFKVNLLAGIMTVIAMLLSSYPILKYQTLLYSSKNGIYEITNNQLTIREKITLISIIGAILAIGINPDPLLKIILPSIHNLQLLN